MRLTRKIIADTREKMGDMTLMEAAEIIGVTFQALSKWLNGDVEDLRKSNALKLCAFIGLDYEAEMRRQRERLDIPAHTHSISVGGDNSGQITQVEGSRTNHGDILRKITECAASDADKMTTIRVLTMCGVL